MSEPSPGTFPELLAHGVGGRQDLPIPFGFAVTGAALALVISFVVLGAFWREPRLGDPEAGRPLPERVGRVVDSAGWRWALRLLGLVVVGYFGVGLFLGPDVDRNPTAGAFYVLFWVGLVPLSLLFGSVWRALNPLRTGYLLVAAAVRRDPRRGLLPLPARLGYWPAALGLLAFVWLELVAPDRATVPVIRTWVVAYAIVVLVGAVLFGVDFFDRGDAFEVYSDLVGRLAVVGRRDDGTLVWRNPLEGMSALPPAPGFVAVVVVLLGSTLFDSLSNAPAWFRLAQNSELPPVFTNTVGMLALIGLVLAAYGLTCLLAARLAPSVRPGEVAAEIAHCIVPIAVGYVLAHYYSLLVLEGQRTVALLSDPLVTGTANWLGTAHWSISAALVTPAGVATLQVTLIVLGHLIGTVLSHDRALVLFPGRAAVAAQVPLLVLMVGYTVAGLLLLFAG
ncbi:hypothetical protein ACIBF5_20395 [Micromonospora sp. NPDC050417]|uniref:hypothetical protein n=1 Tax=Micromonospora sp. NPDC050417 TaxID=3364280 RepID=UPI0037905A05